MKLKYVNLLTKKNMLILLLGETVNLTSAFHQLYFVYEKISGMIIVRLCWYYRILLQNI